MLLKCEIESLEKMPNNKYDTLTRSIIVNDLNEIKNQISEKIVNMRLFLQYILKNHINILFSLHINRNQ